MRGIIGNVASPFKWIKKKISGAFGKMGKMGKGTFGKMLKGVPVKLMNDAKSWFHDKMSKSAADKQDSSSGLTDVGKVSSKHAQKAIKRAAANSFGWSGGQWSALNKLVSGESGWNPKAKNASSGAYGLFQALPASKIKGNKNSIRAQANFGLNYIKDRYGSPKKAWSAWQGRSPHWYASGTTSAMRGPAIVGEGGPELVNFKGGEQVRDASETKRMMGQTPAIYVQNPWTGEYHEARMRAISEEGFEDLSSRTKKIRRSGRYADV